MVACTIPKTRQNTRTTPLVATFAVLHMENRWTPTESGVPRMTILSRHRGNGPIQECRYGGMEQDPSRAHRVRKAATI